MTSSTYLDHEVALLLAKYGSKAVLAALARNMQLSPDELESLLKKLPSKKPAARSRKSPAPVDPIEQLIQQHPAKARYFRSLQVRFQSRTFLPELRDVRRFFEQHSQALGSIKSRTESFTRLFRLLADLDLTELDELCQADPHGEYSSLGLIADEILKE